MEASGTSAYDGAYLGDHSDGQARDAAPTSRCRALRVTQHGRRRVYTRRLRTLQVALLLIGTALVAMGPVGEMSMAHPSLAPLAGVVTACGLLLALRWWRAAIVIAPGRVTIRGLLFSRRLDSQSVTRFEAPSPYGLAWHAGMRIYLTNGKVRHAGVFTATPIDGNAVGRDETDELNVWLTTQDEDTHTAGNWPAPPERSVTARIAWGVWVGVVAFIALMTVIFGVMAMNPTEYVN